MKKDTCIIGFDPGFGRCGWSILRTARNGYEAEFGCIETRASETPERRLAHIFEEATAIVERAHPEAVAVERLFFSKNVKTALAVAEARGVLLLLAARAHLPIVSLAPTEIKRAVTGWGGAEKRQVGRMIAVILQLKNPPRSDDAADALALAYAALMRHTTDDRISRQRRKNV